MWHPNVGPGMELPKTARKPQILVGKAGFSGKTALCNQLFSLIYC
jgi:hypothetical protein